MVSFDKLSISTERFLLRPLAEDDATERYLSWMRGEGSQNIVSAALTHNLEDLRGYICDKSAQVDTWFLGVFDKNTLNHIGNFKFEPVNSKIGYAIVGILIGEDEYRGKGVAQEVIRSAGRYLRDNFSIHEILLGVYKTNNSAIRAYEKCGFEVCETPHIASDCEQTLKMRLATTNLP